MFNLFPHLDALGSVALLPLLLLHQENFPKTTLPNFPLDKVALLVKVVRWQRIHIEREIRCCVLVLLLCYLESRDSSGGKDICLVGPMGAILSASRYLGVEPDKNASSHHGTAAASAQLMF